MADLPPAIAPEAEVVPSVPATVQEPRKPGFKKGIASVPEAPRETEAHFLFEELLDEFRQKGWDPGSMTVHVARIEPPPQTPLGSFSGAACRDAEEFYSYIATYFHAKSKITGAAQYSVQFRVRGGQWKRHGYLRLPPPEEVVLLGPARAYGTPGMMNAGGYPQQQQPYPYPPGFGGGPPPGYASFRYDVPQLPPAPTTAQAALPAAAPQPPSSQGFGATPQDHEVAHLRVQVSYLSGQLTELVSAMREGRMPVAPTQPPPVGVAAPPVALAVQPTAYTPDSFAEALLKRLGVGLGLAPTAAAAPAPAAPAAIVPAAGLAAKTAIQELQTMVHVVKTLKGIGRELDGLFMGDQPEGPAENPFANLPVVEEPEEPKLPFHVIPIPEVKLGEHNIAYARNRETGKIDLEGVVFSNPVIAQKVMDIVQTLVTSAAKAAGMGPAAAAAAQPAAPQQPQQLPSQTPPVATNGAPAAGAWPKI